MLANRAVCLYRVDPTENYIFMRGGWTPPWLHSHDMVCGAPKRANGRDVVVRRPAITLKRPSGNGQESSLRVFQYPFERCPAPCNSSLRKDHDIEAVLVSNDGTEKDGALLTISATTGRAQDQETGSARST